MRWRSQQRYSIWYYLIQKEGKGQYNFVLESKSPSVRLWNSLVHMNWANYVCIQFLQIFSNGHFWMKTKSKWKWRAFENEVCIIFRLRYYCIMFLYVFRKTVKNTCVWVFWNALGIPFCATRGPPPYTLSWSQKGSGLVRHWSAGPFPRGLRLAPRHPPSAKTKSQIK